MASVRMVYYLNRRYPSKTHRYCSLFRNTAIALRATSEFDITIGQPTFCQKVAQSADVIGETSLHFNVTPVPPTDQ